MCQGEIPLLRIFWACFPAVAQIVEVTCKGFTGSSGFGKEGLEVSGHRVGTEAFLALSFFIVVVVRTGRTLVLQPFLLSPPLYLLFYYNDGSSISVPDSFVSRVNRDQLSSRLAFSTSNQCCSM